MFGKVIIIGSKQMRKQAIALTANKSQEPPLDYLWS